jgi:hypothetical protein
METSAFTVGVVLKEVATSHAHYHNCSVLHSDSIGLVFEAERTLSEGGNVETVLSQVLVPWGQIHYVVLVEERS